MAGPSSVGVSESKGAHQRVIMSDASSSILRRMITGSEGLTVSGELGTD